MPTTQLTRPRGRRPGNDDTRGTIAASAVTLFEARGYEATSLRAIARNADVDPALVHHYFVGKAQLFATVCLPAGVDFVTPLVAAAEGEPATMGQRITKAFFDVWDAPAHHDDLLAFISTEPHVLSHRRLLHEFLGREVFSRLASDADHTNALVRGQLAASTLLGVLAARQRLQLNALCHMSYRSMYEPVGRCLQHLLVEPW